MFNYRINLVLSPWIVALGTFFVLGALLWGPEDIWGALLFGGPEDCFGDIVIGGALRIVLGTLLGVLRIVLGVLGVKAQYQRVGTLLCHAVIILLHWN